MHVILVKFKYLPGFFASPPGSINGLLLQAILVFCLRASIQILRYMYNIRTTGRTKNTVAWNNFNTGHQTATGLEWRDSGGLLGNKSEFKIAPGSPNKTLSSASFSVDIDWARLVPGWPAGHGRWRKVERHWVPEKVFTKSVGSATPTTAKTTHNPKIHIF